MNTPLTGCLGRTFLLSLVWIGVGIGGATASDTQTYHLAPPDSQTHRVKVTLEVQGKLKLLTPEKQERQIPLTVSGNFLYDEIIAESPEVWSSRAYQTAEAEIKLDKTTHRPQLEANRRVVGVRVEEGKPRFWSPGGPLSRDESELIELQANSVLLSGLLPSSPVAVGETWTPDSAMLTGFLMVDAVNSNDLKCKLAETRDGRAVVELTGKVAGAAEGVATEIEVSAKYAYHLAERRFTSVAMAWRENRTVGQAEPGFEVVARLTMTLTPIASSAELTDAVVASVRTGLGVSPPLRYESTEQGFRVLLDPRWRVIMDRRDVTVLRFIDGNDVIAQCNVSTLPALEEGRKLQLEEFQRDIQKALGENFGQFLEASLDASPTGLRVMRVSAAGTASELPIHWIYCHVSNDEGRRVSYVFTMEAEKADRFAGADAAFTSSLELFPPTPQETETSPAKQARAK